MHIRNFIAEKGILKELAGRFTQQRIALGLSQAALADRAGVGKRTVERFEAGSDIQFKTLIKLLRALELLDQLNQLIPEPVQSPIRALETQQDLPQRVSRKKRSVEPWKWGDEK